MLVGRYARRVLVVGCQHSYERFCNAQAERGDNRYSILGYIPGETSPTRVPFFAEFAPTQNSDIAKVLAATQPGHSGATALVQSPEVALETEVESNGKLDLMGKSLFEYCLAQDVDDVVVEFRSSPGLQLSQSLMFCTAQGINVMETTAFFEKYLECVHESTVDERWFWGFDPAHQHPFYSAFKRSLDIAASLAGMLAFAPFAPFVVLAIKLQDGGPVFYSQIRTGLYNRPFRILKFRTMRMDAEKLGAQWAKLKDNRVTWLGTFLRKSRIDEVPQFWNILRGDMSFVGPRPERPEMIDKIEQEVRFFRYRHLIKPGLTGWAQINYPYGASIEDARMKLSYDFYYLKYANPLLDIMIVLRTFVAMARGAR